MKYLAQFTPAESLLVLEGPRAVYNDQLKYTLMDLFFKNVLQTTEIRRKVSYKDPESVYNYVVRGPNFYSYQAQPHEMVFLAPYFRMSEAKILFRHLVKMGFENAGSQNRFNKWMVKGRMYPYFRNNFLDRLFGTFSHTKEGTDARDALREEVGIMARNIHEGANLPALIGLVYGNICLANVNMEMIRAIESSLNEEVSRTQNNSTYYSSWSSCGSWSSFDHGHGGGSGCGSSCGNTGHGHSGCGNSGCSNSGCSGSGCSSSGCSSGCSGCGGGGSD